MQVADYAEFNGKYGLHDGHHGYFVHASASVKQRFYERKFYFSRGLWKTRYDVYTVDKPVPTCYFPNNTQEQGSRAFEFDVSSTRSTRGEGASGRKMLALFGREQFVNGTPNFVAFAQDRTAALKARHWDAVIKAKKDEDERM